MIEALFADDDALVYLQGRGLSTSTVIDAKLGYCTSAMSPRFGDSIAIPYFDAQHRHRATRYRHLRPGTRNKYDAPAGSSRHLYGVEAISSPVVYVTEGEFDSLILRQLGAAAVAIPGAQSWDRSWRWLFRDCDLVVVALDSDEEGTKAQRKVASQVATVTEVETIDLPAGMDVTELWLTNPTELRRLMQL